MSVLNEPFREIVLHRVPRSLFLLCKLVQSAIIKLLPKTKEPTMKDLRVAVN
jgi:hypothetical protein